MASSPARSKMSLEKAKVGMGMLGLAALSLLIFVAAAWLQTSPKASPAELTEGRVVEVPAKMLQQMNKELALDTKTMSALNSRVTKLSSEVARWKQGRRGRVAQRPKMNPVDKAMQLQATRSAEEEKKVALQSAKRQLVERQMDLLRDFPYWAANAGMSDAAKGHGANGEWRVNRGPPYVAANTLYSGDGVDRLGSGNLVRRIVGIKTSFRFHKWEGNGFITDFDGPQFRFEYRNQRSNLVIPPLVNGGPLLGWNAIHRLYLYVNYGHNALIVTGGPSSVLFINSNVINTDGGYDLDPKWAPGPYERQPAAEGTPFAACAATLPGPGTQVHGVALASLPAEAISYYEAGDVSVAFEIPSGEGRLIYLGFDFTEPVVPWVHALIAAMQFNEFDIKKHR